jgi:hypothetical protein
MSRATLTVSTCRNSAPVRRKQLFPTTRIWLSSRRNCARERGANETVVDGGVAAHRGAQTDPARIHSDQIKAPMQRRMPQVQARHLDRHDLAASAAWPTGIDDQAADPVPAVRRTQASKPQADLATARVRVVQRHVDRAALKVGRCSPAAMVPPDRAPSPARRGARERKDATKRRHGENASPARSRPRLAGGGVGA